MNASVSLVAVICNLHNHNNFCCIFYIVDLKYVKWSVGTWNTVSVEMDVWLYHTQTYRFSAMTSLMCFSTAAFLVSLYLTVYLQL